MTGILDNGFGPATSILDSVSVSTGTLALDTTKVETRFVTLQKVGKLVVARIELKTVTSLGSGWVTIATLPTGYRPDVSGRVLWSCNEDTTIQVGSVESGGAVKIVGTSVASNSIITANVTYFTT